MLPITFSPLPVIVSLFTAFGVFMHDTQLDSAAITVMSMPAAIMATGETAKLNLPDPHIHAERHIFSTNLRSLRTSQPSMQPRNENDKKYVIQKRLWGNTFGSDYSWPSI